MFQTKEEIIVNDLKHKTMTFVSEDIEMMQTSLHEAKHGEQHGAFFFFFF